MEFLLCERVYDLRHSLFHLLNYLITTAFELMGLIRKVTGSKLWTIGRVRKCRDAHLGQKVCDKDGIVDWCRIVDPIWRVHASFDGISSWIPFKPQHSNPKPNLNPLVNQLWCIDFLTPCTLLITHRLPGFLESLMPLKNWCSIHARHSKSSLKHSIGFFGIFPSLKQNFLISFF